MGFPICNDSIYNDFSWGPLKGKGCDYGEKSIEQVKRIFIKFKTYFLFLKLNKDVTKQHDKKSWISVVDPDYEQRLAEIGENDMVTKY